LLMSWSFHGLLPLFSPLFYDFYSYPPFIHALRGIYTSTWNTVVCH
jgi:hypothetical protein